MATIELHPLIESAAGRLGGLVITTWKGIHVLRGKGFPSNPRTPLQQENRSAFGEIVRQWRSLPPETKERWNDLARGRPLSGYNEFIAVNMRRLKTGSPLLLDGPEEERQQIHRLSTLST